MIPRIKVTVRDKQIAQVQTHNPHEKETTGGIKYKLLIIYTTHENKLFGSFSSFNHKYKSTDYHPNSSPEYRTVKALLDIVVLNSVSSLFTHLKNLSGHLHKTVKVQQSPSRQLRSVGLWAGKSNLSALQGLCCLPYHICFVKTSVGSPGSLWILSFKLALSLR